MIGLFLSAHWKEWYMTDGEQLHLLDSRASRWNIVTGFLHTVSSYSDCTLGKASWLISKRSSDDSTWIRTPNLLMKSEQEPTKAPVAFVLCPSNDIRSGAHAVLELIDGAL